MKLVKDESRKGTEEDEGRELIRLRSGLSLRPYADNSDYPTTLASVIRVHHMHSRFLTSSSLHLSGLGSQGLPSSKEIWMICW